MIRTIGLVTSLLLLLLTPSLALGQSDISVSDISYRSTPLASCPCKLTERPKSPAQEKPHAGSSVTSPALTASASQAETGVIVIASDVAVDFLMVSDQRAWLHLALVAVLAVLAAGLILSGILVLGRRIRRKPSGKSTMCKTSYEGLFYYS